MKHSSRNQKFPGSIPVINDIFKGHGATAPDATLFVAQGGGVGKIGKDFCKQKKEPRKN